MQVERVMSCDELPGRGHDGVDEALARLIAQVEAEPVSDRLRQLAQQLTDALTRHEVAQLPPSVSAGQQEAPHG